MHIPTLHAYLQVLNSLIGKTDHVPYRNSKLTTLLQPCLRRGCRVALIIGASPAVADAAHAHKRQFVDYVTDLVVEAGCSPELGLQIALLAEGAQTTAAISESPEAAIAARRAAAVLLDAAARP